MPTNYTARLDTKLLQLSNSLHEKTQCTSVTADSSSSEAEVT